MANRLVTVATFHEPVAAAMAQNFLANEGIPAILTNETTITMLAGAIGGIQLQVAPLHLERAEMLLTQVREERAAAQDELPVPHTAIATQETAEELQAEREDREPINQLTDKLLRSAVFGLVFWPLQLYTLFLLLIILQSEGTVSPKRRWKVWMSALLNIPLVIVVVLLLQNWLSR